jgi:hypothetical protein
MSCVYAKYKYRTFITLFLLIGFLQFIHRWKEDIKRKRMTFESSWYLTPNQSYRRLRRQFDNCRKLIFHMFITLARCKISRWFKCHSFSFNVFFPTVHKWLKSYEQKESYECSVFAISCTQDKNNDENLGSFPRMCQYPVIISIFFWFQNCNYLVSMWKLNNYRPSEPASCSQLLPWALIKITVYSNVHNFGSV